MRLATPTSLHAAVGDALAGVPQVALALVFGSCARGTAHAGSDWEVPATYADVFRVLAERNVLDHDLAARMAAVVGLRNLIAHRYGALDWVRIHDIASNHIEDLLRLCDTVADAAINGSAEP